jgi:hypothetical protein
MNSRNREIAGVIVAPLSIPFVVLVFGSSGVFGVQGVFSTVALFVSVIFSYFGMFILGFPAIFALKKYGSYSLGWIVLIGMFGGVVIWFIFLELFSRYLGNDEGLSYISVFFGAIMGALVSFIYSLIAGVGISGRAI